MLILRGILRVAVQVVFFGAILFLPIGSWKWPRAVLFLAVFGSLSLISGLLLAKFAPASLEARVKKGATKDQPKADKLILLLLAFLHISWFIMIPNDVFRWEVFPSPPFGVSVLGAALCFMGYGLMLTSVWQNSFATPVVGDQSERGQTLVDTGLYGWVRHPLYLGLLFFLLGLPLWLESTLCTVLVPVVFSPLLFRIQVEEKSLMESLEGYSAYKDRVPHRLLPYLW
jgi:protein-S-isoprenylcysteine O-methyltransferase Ste14